MAGWSTAPALNQDDEANVSQPAVHVGFLRRGLPTTGSQPGDCAAPPVACGDGYCHRRREYGGRGSVLSRPDRKHGRHWFATFVQALGRQAGVEERVNELGKGPVRGTNPGANALGRP